MSIYIINMGNKSYILLAIALIFVINVLKVYGVNEFQYNNDSDTGLNTVITNLDEDDVYMHINDCYIEYTPEYGLGFYITLNDSTAILRTQSVAEFNNNHAYTQVTLTDDIAEQIRDAVYKIYSKHESILRNKKNNVKYIKFWNIEVDIDGRHITDRVAVDKQVELKGHAFVDPFIDFTNLFFRIGCRIRYDLYNSDYVFFKKEREIAQEMGQFYDPESVKHGNF